MLLDIKTAPRLDFIKEYYFSRKLREIAQLRASGRDIISLGIGSPDMPPHEDVVRRLTREAMRPDTHAYQPYTGAAVLREAFAAWYSRWYGVSLDAGSEVLPLIGSKEGIVHICMTYISTGDKVLVPNPGYPTYRSAVKLAGGEVVDYVLSEKNGYLPDFGEIERAGLDGVKMMILNYPHMPTGTYASRELFEKFVAFARRHNILLVHDNPYSFIRNRNLLSLLSIEGAKDVSIELNSLSKGHSMAGWRVGVMCAHAQRITEVLKFKSNMDSGMFYPVQAAAATALELGEDWYTALNRTYSSREKWGFSILDALGCTYRDEQAGLFLWARIPDSFEGDCYAFSDRVLERCDVFVTPGAVFGDQGLRYIRISLCAEEQTLHRALENIKRNF